MNIPFSQKIGHEIIQRSAKVFHEQPLDRLCATHAPGC
jgi:hypothetical protein